MVGQFSTLKGLLQGLAWSLLGGVLVVIALWKLPGSWLGDIPLMLRLVGSIALLCLPGLLRVIQLWHTDRYRQAWSTLGGCTIGAVILILLGALFVAIAVG